MQRRSAPNRAPAAGPAVPAIEAVGYDTFCAALTETLSPMYDPDLGVRSASCRNWAGNASLIEGSPFGATPPSAG
jgi:hypothetical protein